MKESDNSNEENLFRQEALAALSDKHYGRPGIWDYRRPWRQGWQPSEAQEQPTP